MSNRKEIEQNSIKISKQANGVDAQYINLILRVLHLKTENIYLFKNALSNLKRINSISKKYAFPEILPAIKVFESDLYNNDSLAYLSRPSTKNRSSSFLLENKVFSTNNRYFIFAGMSDRVAKSLSLEFNLSQPDYYPLLTIGLISIFVLNKLTIDEEQQEKYGLTSFLSNLKLLMSNHTWQLEITKVVKSCLSETGTKKELTSYSIAEFFKDFSELPNLDKSDKHIQFIDKLRNLKKDIEDLLPESRGTLDLLTKFDENEFEQQEIDLNPPQIFEGLVSQEDRPSKEDNEESQFLRTIGSGTSERSAQVFSKTNKTLFPREVHSIEYSIQQVIYLGKQASETQIKVALIRALMLYYSMRSVDTYFILIGCPNLDYEKEQMDGRIVIDLAHNTIYLPTPSQQLHRNPDESYKYLHLPLPLIHNVSLLLSMLPSTSPYKLSDIISKNDIKLARSFKEMKGFKQYRMVAKKVSDTLWTEVFLRCQDEVKTAYVQGGAYPYIHMGTYYTTLKVRELHELYRTTVQAAFRKAKFNDEVLTDKADDSVLDDFDSEGVVIGSIKTPSLKSVKVFIANKHRLLEEQKRSLKSFDKLVDFHNEFSMYVLNLLFISTTHRPNNDPFYHVKNFIHGNALVQITEKVVMEGFEGRLAVLSRDAREQILLYLRHLEYLQKAFAKSGFKQLSTMLKSVKQGDQNPKNGVPLFFLIKRTGKDKVTYSLNSIKRTDVRHYYVENDVPFSENYYRHLFSSYLAFRKVPRFYIAAQMGHISKGREPYSVVSNFSPSLLEDNLEPHISALFSDLQVKVCKTPDIKKYLLDTFQSVSYLPSKLGPFMRAEARMINNLEELVVSLNQLLFGKETVEKNKYVNLSVANDHLVRLQDAGVSSPTRLLKKYYEFHRSHNNWLIQPKARINKSPFNPSFAFEFSEGEHSVKIVQHAIEDVVNAKRILSVVEQRVLFALSALISGSVLLKEHIIDASNKNISNFIDVGMTQGCELIDSNGNVRLWLLNSVSLVVLKCRVDDSGMTVDETIFNDVLNNSFALPEINRLVKVVTSYLRVFLPSYLVEYSLNTSFQNTIGLAGLKSMMGDYSLLNVQSYGDNALSQSLHVEELIVGTGNHDMKILKQFSSELSQAYQKRIGKKATLDSLNAFMKKNQDAFLRDFVAQLIAGWVLTRLEKSELDLGSISTYFSNIYDHVYSRFSVLKSAEEMTDEYLLVKLYPQILKDLEQSHKGKIPTSSLKDFHSYLADNYDLNYLHFKGRSVYQPSQIEFVLTEDQYLACLGEIEADTDLDRDVKESCKLSLMLFRRCGLRPSELFKLQYSDICIRSKIIHVSGNYVSSEKTASGNRLIPYSLLLSKREVNQLESWTRKMPKIIGIKYLLFDRQIKARDLLSIKQVMSTYLIEIIRSVTGNYKLSFRSLRKGFASDNVLKLALYENQKSFLESLYQAQNSFSRAVESYYHTAQPHNLFWLLADWMGHSSPKTTFEHYSLTLDIPLFAQTELLAENRLPKYLLNLRMLVEKLYDKQRANPDSLIKNLRRYEGEKYISLYLKHLANSEKERFQARTAKHLRTLNLSLSAKELYTILSLYFSGHSCIEIDDSRVLEKGVSSRVVARYKGLIKQDVTQINLPDEIYRKIVESLNVWRLDVNGVSAWVSKASVSLLENMKDMDEKYIDQLFEIWIAQIHCDLLGRGEIYVTKRKDLITFAGIFSEVLDEMKETANLLIKLKGKKVEHDEMIHWLSGFEYCLIKDQRKLVIDEIPFTEYVISFSYRDGKAEKIATCSYALNAAIFFAKLLKLNSKN